MAARPHILINSLQRSGGTLVARLLDGHPAVRSLPFELLYALQKVRLPHPEELAGLAADWGAFKTTMLFPQNYERIASRNYFGKDVYSKTEIGFDYSEFDARIKDWFEAARGEVAYAEALSACVDAFFDVWRGAAPTKGPEVSHVNHLSMMCFADPASFFALFPRGRIVQSLRDPYSWYASMKGHFGIADMSRVYMTFALEVWCESVLRCLVAARFWPGQYLLVRYSDLVTDCDATMKKIATNLGLEFDEVLTRPTLGGQAWLGNSSFGAKQGVDRASLDGWRNSLTREEIDSIETQTGEIGRLLAQNHRFDVAALPESIEHPTSGVREPLTARSREELLAHESQRMSLLTFNVFTRTIQRAEGARYNTDGDKAAHAWKKLVRLFG